ncbi:hypothetical protein [Acidovorax sp. K2F]|uniref:hypothetical protein n=1 Tax=Acidovorax sp. K2F TaxID=2978125 RepID=UPI0021B0F655|nr:hypothetical protein [Acidovorax sp. K2F]MCT6721610.1 hypothetical protein [Acidovorax sp. K2F]
MDLNERLAARRKELAEEAERARIEADKARQAELEAARQAAQAKVAAEPPLPDPMTLQTPAKKAVDIDEGVELLKDAVERTTKKQVAIFCAMAVLALIGLSQDTLMAIFWAVCALGYIAFTLGTHIEDIKKSSVSE